MLETCLIERAARALLLTACFALGCTVVPATDAGADRDGGGSCSCEGRECGDDSCGATCGFCSAGQSCVDGTCIGCSPSCAGRECGDDGCGSLCGTCAIGQVCTTAGRCEGGCTPSCDGRECGPDGCGGSCGSCPAGRTCEDGTCSPSCTPICAGRECGPDSCGGSCGTCGAGEVCDAEGRCVCTPVTCYRDGDGDGYPNPKTGCAMTECECPTGYMAERADGAWDCEDGNAAIHPGADYGIDNFCPLAANSCGGLGVICSHGHIYDQNCDGVVQQRWTTIGGGCLFQTGTGCRVVNGGAGWTGAVPGCGDTGTWFTGACNASCMAINETRQQQCR